MKRELKCQAIVASIDFFACFVSLFVALGLVKLFFGDVHRYLPSSQFDDRVLMHAVASCLAVIWFWIHYRHYTYRKPFWFELREVLNTLLVFAVIELAMIAFSKSHMSRYLWVITWLCVLFFVPVARILVRTILRRLSWSLRDTVIIGNKTNAMDAYLALRSEPYLSLQIKAFVGNDNAELPSDITVPIVNEEDILTKFNKDSTQFVIALEEGEFDKRSEWLRFFSTYGCRMVTVVPTVRGLPLHGTDVSFLFSHDVMLLRVNNNLARPFAQFLKRMMDIIGSLVIIILISPLLLILFFLIAKDRGSVIYGHTRVGRHRRPFKCLKFRSMVLNSQEVLDELLKNDAEAKAEWDRDFKLKNDPRITKVGHFIRRTSLDELPQLFNVLRGEMSLVGPRPIVEEELQRYEEDLDYYLMVKPGMTGLWQISGRNDVDYETRVYFDAWYVKNWSIWNDIAILFKTVSVVCNRSGAY